MRLNNAVSTQTTGAYRTVVLNQQTATALQVRYNAGLLRLSLCCLRSERKAVIRELNQYQAQRITTLAFIWMSDTQMVHTHTATICQSMWALTIFNCVRALSLRKRQSIT